MADDDEIYVTIGTAFDIPEEDEAPKRRFDKHEQLAVDEKGRRRFHGAFTGGFSAGYFNTVGTKEGWTPSTFKSSRSSRVSKESAFQKPEDFMDEEDFAEHGIAPKKFTTKENFTPAEKEVAERKRTIVQAIDEGVLRSAVPGGLPVDDLITPSKVTIGVRLLRKMGWKEGQGVGDKVKLKGIPKATATLPKKVYGCSLPTQSEDEDGDIDANSLQQFLAPKDVQPIDFTPKDNNHGIGYSGVDPNMFLGAGSLSGVFKPTGSEKRGIRGQAFGVGAFEEEDENVYCMDDMSDYDFAMSSEKESNRLQNLGWTGPPKKDKSKDAISGFHKASVPTAINKIFRAPLLPQNFIPKHEFNNAVKPAVIGSGSNRNFLTSADRALLLGEREGRKSFDSVFDIVPEKDRRKIDNVKRGIVEKSQTVDVVGSTADNRSDFVRSKSSKRPSRWESENEKSVPFAASTASHDGNVFKPFAKDPEKQQRYDSFLSAKKIGKECKLHFDGTMTEWEKEREMEEFSRAAILYRPMSASISSRFTRGSNAEDSASVTKSKDDDDNDDGEKSDSKNAAKLGLFGKLTRQIHDWHPSSLLCKRFNVPDPYPESRFTGTVGRDRKSLKGWLPDLDTSVQMDHSGDKLDKQMEIDNRSSDRDESLDQSKSDSAGHQERAVLEDSSSNRKASNFQNAGKCGPLSYLNDIDEEANTRNSEIDATGDEGNAEGISKPPMDLFKAIFAESSESSEDELESDDKLVTNVDASKGSDDIDSSTPSTADKGTNDIDEALVKDGLNGGNQAGIESDLNMIITQEATFLSESSMHSHFGRSLPPEEKSQGAVVEGRLKMKRLPEAKQFASASERGGRAKELDKRTTSPDYKELRKEKLAKEGYREMKKRKKKEKKNKKKKKKQKKKEQKERKSRDTRHKEETSSSEWSSYSGDNSERITGVNSGSRDFKRERRSNRGDVESCKSTAAFKDTRKMSIGSSRERNLNEENNPEKNVKAKVDAKPLDKSRKKVPSSWKKVDDKRLDTRSTEIDPKSQSSIKSAQGESKEKSYRKNADSKVERSSTESVPSAKEIYERLKKHGVSIKRKSAADFM